MQRLFRLALVAGSLAFFAHGAGSDAPASKGQGQRGNPEAVFKKIDTNGDGKLSKDEFKAFIEKASKGKGKLREKPELIDKLFEHLDTNGDGYLSLEEFKKLRDLREKIAERKKAKKAKEEASPDR